MPATCLLHAGYMPTVWGDGVEGADDTVRSGDWLGAMGSRYPSLHTLALACHWDIDGSGYVCLALACHWVIDAQGLGWREAVKGRGGEGTG